MYFAVLTGQRVKIKEIEMNNYLDLARGEKIQLKMTLT